MSRIRFCILLLLLICCWTVAGTAEEPPAPPAPEPSAGSAEDKPAHPLQVRLIQFRGNHVISSGDLKKVMTTHEKRFRWFFKAPFDENVFKEDLERIETYYRSQGFYHARVVSWEVVPMVSDNVRIEIRVEEGEPMIITDLTVVVDGDKTGSWNDDVLKVLPLKAGERFTAPGYEDSERAAASFFGDWGYPKAKIDLKGRLDKGTNKGTLTLVVEKGPICEFGPITFEGNEHVKTDIIRRELTFHEGERFSSHKVSDSQQKLFSLDLFQFVDLSVQNLDGPETVLPIRVLVKESKPQTVRVGVGYGTEDQLRGQVQWELRDFLGDGRRLQVNAKASSLIQLLDTKFTQPYLFDPKSNLTVGGGILHEDQESFENRKIYVNPMVNYKWSERLSSQFGYNLETNRLMDVKVAPQVLGPEDQENQAYLVSSLVSGVLWEKVDNQLNPRNGVRVIPTLEWASSTLGSQVDFVKFTIEGRGYLPVWSRSVLAGKLKWGTIQRLENTQELPIFKRFFAGGSDSVRGWPYQKLGPLDKDGNPIGGLSLLEGSVEYRFPVRPPFEGVLFFDFGNVFLESFELSELGYAAGCGVRYQTPVGPLRVDFGYQLNPPEGDFFNPYQIQVSIGQAF